MKSRIVRGAEALLWLVAVACIGTVAQAKWQSARAQEAAIGHAEAAWSAQSSPAVLAEPAPDRALWSGQRRRAYDRALAAADALAPQAILTIPSIGLDVAVFEGTSEHVLNVGVGRVPGTARAGEIGNVALAGHRDGFFRGLKDIRIGDEIVLRGPHGADRYAISSTEIVGPDEVRVLAPTTDAVLTLITCYPFYFVGNAPERFIVRAELIEDEPKLLTNGD